MGRTRSMTMENLFQGAETLTLMGGWAVFGVVAHRVVSKAKLAFSSSDAAEEAKADKTEPASPSEPASASLMERKFHEDTAKAIFKKIDKNSDGNLTKNEIIKFLDTHEDGKDLAKVIDVCGEDTDKKKKKQDIFVKKCAGADGKEKNVDGSYHITESDFVKAYLELVVE